MPIHHFVILLSASFLAQIAHADEDGGLLAARGATYALAVAEKCAGKPLQSLTASIAQQRKLIATIENEGYDGDLVRKGILQGAFNAENDYPGKSKPSRKECKKAAKIVHAIEQL